MPHSSTLPVLLKQLKLSTMKAFWESYLDKAKEQGWDPATYLTALCEEEVNQRYTRRITRFFKEAKLPPGKTMSSFDFNHIPDFDSGTIEAMSSDSSWVERAENLLFFGPSGTGKTHLAVAICNGLIEQSIRVRYYQATALVQELQRARAELQLEKTFARLDKYRVLILDDIGYVKKNDAETHVLFELIAHRYESGSMIITANHPFSEWDKIFTDTMMTVAAIDRLVHHASIIEIQAESFRRKEAMGNKTIKRDEQGSSQSESQKSSTEISTNRN